MMNKSPPSLLVLTALLPSLSFQVNETLRFIVTLEDEVPDGRNNILQVAGTAIILDVNDNAPTFLGVSSH